MGLSLSKMPAEMDLEGKGLFQVNNPPVKGFAHDNKP